VVVVLLLLVVKWMLLLLRMRACLAGVTAEHAADERFTRPEQAADVVADGEARSGLRHRQT
jgi:hypothetical protein